MKTTPNITSLRIRNSIQLVLRKYALVVGLLLGCLTSSSAQDSVVLVNNKIYSLVGLQPEFPGGADSLNFFINEFITHNEIKSKFPNETKVYVGFVVEKDGQLSNVEMIRRADAKIDTYIIDLVRSMPNWIPGGNGGEALRVKYTLRIRIN